MYKYFLFILLLILYTDSLVFPLTNGDKAPAFYLKTLDNKDFFLRDYCGEPRKPWLKSEKNIVILSFFATWCIPCQKELKELVKLENKNYKNVKIVLVNFKEDQNSVNKFISSNDIEFPVLLDIYGVVAQKYNVNSLPVLYLIDEDQNIIYSNCGYNENLLIEIQSSIDQLMISGR